MFIIREASITDVASVNILEDSAFESLSNFRGLAQFLETSPRIGDGWSEIIEDSKFKLVVGVLGETIHGYLLVEVFAGLHKALIKQVFVDSTARQLGLGALLIERCEQVVRDNGCTVLEGLALPGDRDMKNLFERASMSAQLLIVGKNLA
jgi:GNAT superfamily N-acetyltransferase